MKTACSLVRDGELRTECWKVQFHHFLVELLWQELDIGLECLGRKQNASINQAASAPGPRRNTTSRKTDDQGAQPRFSSRHQHQTQVILGKESVRPKTVR